MNLYYVFHVFPYLSFQPLTHKRLQLEDPSSAPQLDPFVGTFSLATAAPGPRTARTATAGPEATAKVCRALEGYAMQGTKQQLAKELLMEAEMKMVVEIFDVFRVLFSGVYFLYPNLWIFWDDRLLNE